MSVKHTPGKWEKHSSIAGGKVIVIENPVNPDLPKVDIAHCYYNSLPPEQVEANARLIACSPELLKALQDMVCAFEGSDRADHPALKEAKRVIGKAVG